MANRSHLVGAAGVAAAGLLGGHQLSFALAERDPHARAQLLEATGHRYFPLVAATLLILTVLAIGAFAGRRFRSQTRPPIAAWSLFAVLAGLQAGGFLALEASERVFVAHQAYSVGFGLPLILAIAVQLIAAGAGALLLKAVANVIDMLAERTEERTRTDGARSLHSQIRVPSLAAATSCVTRRGPPVFR